MKIQKNKRLKIVLSGLGLNFVTAWIGMYFEADLRALGACLAMINVPLYVYVLGESFRPSKLEDNVE